MVNDALFNRRFQPAVERVASSAAPSFTSSKKRSMLKEATVSSSAVGAGTACAVMLPVTEGTASGRMV